MINTRVLIPFLAKMHFFTLLVIIGVMIELGMSQSPTAKPTPFPTKNKLKYVTTVRTSRSLELLVSPPFTQPPLTYRRPLYRNVTVRRKRNARQTLLYLQWLERSALLQCHTPSIWRRNRTTFGTFKRTSSKTEELSPLEKRLTRLIWGLLGIRRIADYTMLFTYLNAWKVLDIVSWHCKRPRYDIQHSATPRPCSACATSLVSVITAIMATSGTQRNGERRLGAERRRKRAAPSVDEEEEAGWCTRTHKRLL